MNRLAVAAIAVLLVAGCTPDQTPAPAPEEPDQAAIRWIPNPSVDLMSPEGTFIRAATESWNRLGSAHDTGLAAVKERGYPGFTRAFNNSFDLIDSIGGYWDQITVGTVYFEVLRLRRDGDRFIADVCDYRSQTATKQKDGKYYSRGSLPDGSARTYTFGPNPSLAANQQRSPLNHQKGSAQAPSDDVFGTWVLFPSGATEEPAASQCHKLAPGTPMGLPDPYKRSDPPPTLPPDPGWPEGSKA